MALLPEGPFAIAALLLVAGGTLVLLRRGVPKAYGMGVLLGAIFALDIVAGLFRQPPTGAELGFVVDEVARGERWWSPFTAIFVHAGFAHLFGNIFILVTVGPALEDRVGEKRFLAIYFLAGIAGMAAHALLAYTTTFVSPRSLALGASGAIFGVLTAFAARYPRDKLPFIVPGFMLLVLWLPAFIVLLIFLGINLLYMFFETGIAWWGHFAGFLVGLPFAYALPPSPQRAGAKGLPDAEKLAPYATTRETERILDRIRQFTPETRTKDDLHYVDAWLDKFFAKATCAQGHAFTRDGLSATCAGGETRVEFGRAR